MSGSPERRTTARLAESFQFTLDCGGFDVAANTINISSTGLLCRVSKSIPAMSKIDMMLVLPSRLEDGRASEIKAKGVVVRNERDGDFYKIAIFFIDISKPHRKRLETYVSQVLRNAGD